MTERYLPGYPNVVHPEPEIWMADETPDGWVEVWLVMWGKIVRTWVVNIQTDNWRDSDRLFRELNEEVRYRTGLAMVQSMR